MRFVSRSGISIQTQLLYNYIDFSMLNRKEMNDSMSMSMSMSMSIIIKSTIMNQPQHPNVHLLLAIDPVAIRGFNRDVTNQHIGMSIGLTAQQLHLCRWPIELLRQRLSHLIEQQAHAITQTTVNNQQITIEERNRTNQTQKTELERPFYLKSEFLVRLLISIIAFAGALAQGWKKPDEEGYNGLVASAIIAEIVACAWLILVIIEIYIYRACKA